MSRREAEPDYDDSIQLPMDERDAPPAKIGEPDTGGPGYRIIRVPVDAV